MNKIKLPSNEFILLALALAGALTFAYAFLIMDHFDIFSITGWLLLLRGLVLGAAAGLGMAKISNALPRSQKNKAAEKYLQWAFAGFLIVTPLIIAPVTFVTMSPEMQTLDPILRWVVAVATGIFVDALTAGVAFASGKLEADDKPAPSEPKPALAEVKPAKAKPSPLYFCTSEGCERAFKSQAALNAHGAKHKPAIVGYEASTMKPVTKDAPK